MSDQITKQQLHAAWTAVLKALEPNVGICTAIDVAAFDGDSFTLRQKLRDDLQNFKPAGRIFTNAYWWPRTPAGYEVRKAILNLLIEQNAPACISQDKHNGCRALWGTTPVRILSDGAATTIYKAWYSDDPRKGSIGVVLDSTGYVYFVAPDKLTLVDQVELTNEPGCQGQGARG